MTEMKDSQYGLNSEFEIEEDKEAELHQSRSTKWSNLKNSEKRLKENEPIEFYKAP